jgi:anti-anti-sigma factor
MSAHPFQNPQKEFFTSRRNSQVGRKEILQRQAFLMPIDPLTLSIDSSHDETVLHLIGEMDYSSSARIRQTFNALLAEKPQRFVVDIRELDYLDSSGLNDLLYCYRTAQKSGCEFLILVERDRPRRTSHLRQILTYLPAQEVPEAVAAG